MGGWYKFQSANTTPGGGGVIDLTDSVVSEYADVSAVPAGVTTEILSYLVADPLKHLLNVEFGGTNIARYYLQIDGVNKAQYVTYFSGPLDGTWDFRGLVGGLSLLTGSTVRVIVSHERPFSGDFYARLNLLQIVNPPP